MGFFGKLIDSSNREVEAHIVCVVFLTIGFVAIAGLAMWYGKPFDAQAYGIGAGVILGGGGVAAAGQGMQRKQEGE